MPFETARAALQALLAGTAREELQAGLQQLPIHDRYAVLCTACHMRTEVELNCTERARDIEEVLKTNCPFYPGRQGSCLHPLGVRLES